MKVAFVFDTVLLEKTADYYGMTLTYDFFKERYLDKIDELVVITRVSKWNNDDSRASGYKKTNGPNVAVRPILGYNSIPDVVKKRKQIQKELESKLDGVDKVIIRMPSVLGIMAARVCRRKNIPYFIECVACALDGYWNHTNPLGKLIALPMFLLVRKEIRESERVLYVTSEFLQKRYPTDGRGYACSDVVIPPSAFELKHKQNTGNVIQIYTVANVGMKYKGHIYVFRAIRKMVEKNISVKYFLIGNGDQSRLRKAAKRLGIQENIIFVGSKPHDEVLTMLTNADIYIQPSLQEGLPRALIEAMSVGCPAIASDAGGCPELLSKECIFKKRNWRQLEKKILAMVRNDEMLSLGLKNRKIARAYSMLDLNKKRNAIYKEFLHER